MSRVRGREFLFHGLGATLRSIAKRHHKNLGHYKFATEIWYKKVSISTTNL